MSLLLGAPWQGYAPGAAMGASTSGRAASAKGKPAPKRAAKAKGPRKAPEAEETPSQQVKHLAHTW
jgi:hypothetical protein